MTEYEKHIKSLGFPENGDPYWYLKNFEAFRKATEERDKCVAKYSWAILTEETISRLEKYQPFLEIGAGTGYWAYEFRKKGIQIIATEPILSQKWTEIEILTGQCALDKYDDGKHTLLVCWPTYADDWAFKALKEFKGDTVVYVGEGNEGCTADEQFHALLEKDWNIIEEIDIPQWPGLHDLIMIYYRKNKVC